ncbi:hypothetical protein [Cohnella sp. AR92]|uniref:hypothetical protein n=1 Tax=Cohnella sp. AR92 TaxID=648716 RepID=UPI000F8CAA06|nr:hypothetical protein [Cohnella sp. AR92]RUS43560.1 hypothetical protein ELR57_24850 [Cohnella sp. AR92]
MIAWGRIVRSVTVGMVMALLAIGLLPFLLIYVVSDLNGLMDLDASPIVSVVSRFIHWEK